MSIYSLADAVSKAILGDNYGADTSSVTDEDDIIQLKNNEEIEDDDAEQLLNLLEDPVDINSMDRKACFRLPETTYEGCDKLIALRKQKGKLERPDLQSAFAPQQISQFEPFLLKDTAVRFKNFRGELKLRGIDRLQDESNPAGYLRFKGSYDLLPSPDNLYKIKFGVLTLAGERYDPLVYDQSRGMNVTGGKGTKPQLAKGYVAAEHNAWSMILGSYILGFGQKLTFDTSGRTNPDGWYLDNLISEQFEGADYRPYPGLFGAAAELKDARVGGGHTISGAAFYSNSADDLYQYDVVQNDVWDESLDDEAQYVSIPDAYREQIFGGHGEFGWDERKRLGVTAYRGDVSWLLGGNDLAFAEASKFPSDRQAFGAAGIDTAFGTGPVDVFGEYSLMDNSAQAALLKGVYEYSRNFQAELALRSYGTDFDNPHNRGTAAADELDGNRGRDEAGARVRATFFNTGRNLRLRGSYDQWRHYSSEINDREVSFRADTFLEWLDIGSWLKWHDNDIWQGGRGIDYSEAGQKFTWAGIAGTAAIPRTYLSFQYNRYWEDATFYKDSYQQNAAAYMQAKVDIGQGFATKGRVKFYDEDISLAERGEQYWWASLGLEKNFGKSFKLMGRYDYLVHTDARESTLDPLNSDPNPQHVFRANAEWIF